MNKIVETHQYMTAREEGVMVAAAGRVQDSGFAWVVCAACFLIQVMMAAFLHTSGMFYIMFKDGLDASDSALSLITSLNICVIFLVGPVVGALTGRYGERSISIFGVMLSTLSLAGCSCSTQIYHLYILYGLAAGFGLGMTYNSSLSIIPQYFDKYMTVATCIILCGPGIGSFIFPPIIYALENAFGWRGVILMIAGLNAQTLVCCCFFRPVQAKNSHIKITENVDIGKSENLLENDEICQQTGVCELEVPGVMTSEKLKNLSLFKNVTFLCLLGLGLFMNFPVGIVGTHFGSYVLTLGYTKADVVLLYMVWGISSTISRLMLGIFAQVTHTNTGLLILCACILNGVLTLLLPHTIQLWFLYMFVVLYQALLSFYNLLNFTLLVETVHSEQSSVAIGLSLFTCTPGVVIGPPLAAWLYESTLGYSSSFYLSGVLLIIAGLTMVPPAYRIYRRGKTN